VIRDFDMLKYIIFWATIKQYVLNIKKKMSKRSRSRNRAPLRYSKSRRIITQSVRKKRPKDDMDILNDTLLNLDIRTKKHKVPPTRDFVTLCDCEAYIRENYHDIYKLLIDRNGNFIPVLLRSYLAKQNIKHVPTSLYECCCILNLIEEQKLEAARHSCTDA
jgi:hypothetical protein